MKHESDSDTNKNLSYVTIPKKPEKRLREAEIQRRCEIFRQQYYLDHLKKREYLLSAELQAGYKLPLMENLALSK